MVVVFVVVLLHLTTILIKLLSWIKCFLHNKLINMIFFWLHTTVHKGLKPTSPSPASHDHKAPLQHTNSQVALCWDKKGVCWLTLHSLPSWFVCSVMTSYSRQWDGMWPAGGFHPSTSSPSCWRASRDTASTSPGFTANGWKRTYRSSVHLDQYWLYLHIYSFTFLYLLIEIKCISLADPFIQSDIQVRFNNQLKQVRRPVESKHNNTHSSQPEQRATEVRQATSTITTTESKFWTFVKYTSDG